MTRKMTSKIAMIGREGAEGVEAIKVVEKKSAENMTWINAKTSLCPLYYSTIY